MGRRFGSLFPILVLMVGLSGCLDGGFGAYCTEYVVFAQVTFEPGQSPVDITNSSVAALERMAKEFRWHGTTPDSWMGAYETSDPAYDHIPQHLGNLSETQHGTRDWTSVYMNGQHHLLRYGTDDGCTD